ncbi:MAG: hypothetical protein AAFQ45_03680 [Pseudomonadota bacterium]
MRAELKPFVDEFPWLQELDDAALARLDPGDWHLPSPDASHELAAAEDRLSVHLMAYRKEAQGLHDALTTLLEPAKLSAEQLDLLKETEAALADCLLVAYPRPLQTKPIGAKRVGRRVRQ